MPVASHDVQDDPTIVLPVPDHGSLVVTILTATPHVGLVEVYQSHIVSVARRVITSCRPAPSCHCSWPGAAWLLSSIE